jgi:coenzyme PQQ precursor peptide PqqA
MIKKEWLKPEICESDVGMEVTGYQTAETETETEVLF